MEGEILLFFTQWMYTYKYIYECTYIHTYVYLYVHKWTYIPCIISWMYVFTYRCKQVYIQYFSDLFKCYCDWVDSAYRQTWIFSKVLFLIFYKQQIRKKMFLPHSQKVNEFFVVFYGLAATWKFSPSLTPGKSFRNTKADAVSLVLKAPPPDFFL